MRRLQEPEYYQYQAQHRQNCISREGRYAYDRLIVKHPRLSQRIEGQGAGVMPSCGAASLSGF
jgi:hypothetical protein